MPISAVVADTPNYVLMDGNLRMGPKVVQLDAGIECSPIFGFSEKGSYDKFCTNSQRALKPYPLVKGYLRNQIDVPGDSLKLVVIDAAGPSEPYLCAATVEAVLEAQESRTAHVTTAYRLTFDEEAGAYRVVEEGDVENEPFDETHAWRLHAIRTEHQKTFEAGHPANEVALNTRTCTHQPIAHY